MPPKQCIFNWSGGKDSALALYHCLQDPAIRIKYLVTTIAQPMNRVAMHGVREAMLIRQAEEIGIPLYQIRLPEMPGMDQYNETMRHHLSILRSEGITHSIFGDIFLEDLRAYRDSKLAEAGLTGIYPLWERDTQELIDEFFALGFGTVVVCAQARLEHLAGQELSPDLLASLPPDVDVCGENGEFHTFTFKGPIFKNSILYRVGEIIYKEYDAPKTQANSEVKDDNAPTRDGFFFADIL